MFCILLLVYIVHDANIRLYFYIASDNLKMNDYFKRHIPSHIGDADVLEPAQVGHIGLVGEVGADDIKGQARLPPDDDVRSGRCAQQQVSGRVSVPPAA